MNYFQKTSDFSHTKDRSSLLKSRNSQFILKEKSKKKEIKDKNYVIFRKLSSLKSEFTKIFSNKNNNYTSKNKDPYYIREKDKDKNNEKHRFFKNKSKDYFPSSIYINKNYEPTRQTYFSFKSPNNNSCNIINHNFIANDDNDTNTFDSNSNNEERDRNFNNINPSMSGRNKLDDNNTKSIFSDLDNKGKGHITYLRNRNLSILSDGNLKDTLNEETNGQITIKNNIDNDTGKSLILPDIDSNNKLYRDRQKQINKNSIKANSNNNSNCSPKNAKEKKSPYEIYRGNNRVKNSSENRFKNLDIDNKFNYNNNNKIKNNY
jgi:hypothetical protein